VAFLATLLGIILPVLSLRSVETLAQAEGPISLVPQKWADAGSRHGFRRHKRVQPRTSD